MKPRSTPQVRLVRRNNWTNTWEFAITIGGVQFRSVQDWTYDKAKKLKVKVKAAL